MYLLLLKKWSYIKAGDFVQTNKMILMK